MNLSLSVDFSFISPVKRKFSHLRCGNQLGYINPSIAPSYVPLSMLPLECYPLS